MRLNINWHFANIIIILISNKPRERVQLKILFYYSKRSSSSSNDLFNTRSDPHRVEQVGDRESQSQSLRRRHYNIVAHEYYSDQPQLTVTAQFNWSPSLFGTLFQISLARFKLPPNPGVDLMTRFTIPTELICSQLIGCRILFSAEKWKKKRGWCLMRKRRVEWNISWLLIWTSLSISLPDKTPNEDTPCLPRFHVLCNH